MPSRAFGLQLLVGVFAVWCCVDFRVSISAVHWTFRLLLKFSYLNSCCSSRIVVDSILFDCWARHDAENPVHRRNGGEAHGAVGDISKNKAFQTRSQGELSTSCDQFCIWRYHSATACWASSWPWNLSNCDQSSRKYQEQDRHQTTSLASAGPAISWRQQFYVAAFSLPESTWAPWAWLQHKMQNEIEEAHTALVLRAEHFIRTALHQYSHVRKKQITWQCATALDQAGAYATYAQVSCVLHVRSV